MAIKQKITPNLWFDDNAEEATDFYVSIFHDSRITSIARYGEAGPGKPGSVMTIEFELEGQRFVGLNGGPHFRFTEAVSFIVDCDRQEEIDRLWEQLAEGGRIQQCGWLKDRFGLSWQIVYSGLPRLLQDRDRDKAGRVMAALMGMKKIDVAALEAAYEGRQAA